MQNTNIVNSINDIQGNINFRRPNVATEVSLPETQENIKVETAIYNHAKGSIRLDRNFFQTRNMKQNVEKIKAVIIASGIELIENPEVIATRIYYKLQAINIMEHDITQYALALLTAFILYMLPIFIALLKIQLIADKKDWEVINLINVFVIFGMMPPYDIRVVLENMQNVAEVFKLSIAKLYEGVKDGKGERVFDEVLETIEHQELYDLIEIMKISKATGLLNEVHKLDNRLESKLKKLEIQNIRKREAKIRYALIPITIMMMIIGMYFFYGTMEISNPANLNLLGK